MVTIARDEALAISSPIAQHAGVLSRGALAIGLPCISVAVAYGGGSLGCRCGKSSPAPHPSPSASEVETGVADGGPVEFPGGYRPRGPSEDAMYSGLSPAASPRAVPATSTGDGAAAPRNVKLKGYLDAMSVRGDIRIWKQRVTIDVRAPKTRRRLTLQARYEDEHSGGYVTGNALLERLDGVAPKEGGWIELSGDWPQERLHLQTTLPGKDGEGSLELWESLPEEAPLFEVYDPILSTFYKSPYDVMAALELTSNRQVVLTQFAGSGCEPSLIELTRPNDRAAFTLSHDESSHLSCHEGSKSRSNLLGYQIAEELFLFIIELHETSCGAKCSESTTAELAVLSRDGFVMGPALYDSEELPGGIDYPGSGRSTTLHWIDADGRPPVEVLVSAKDSNDPPKREIEIVGYEPSRKGFTLREGYSPRALEAVLAQFEDTNGFESY